MFTAYWKQSLPLKNPVPGQRILPYPGLPWAAAIVHAFAWNVCIIIICFSSGKQSWYQSHPTCCILSGMCSVSFFRWLLSFAYTAPRRSLPKYPKHEIQVITTSYSLLGWLFLPQVCYFLLDLERILIKKKKNRNFSIKALCGSSDCLPERRCG